MKKALILLSAITCTCLMQAQTPFTENPDHQYPNSTEWQSCKNIRAAWGNSDVRYAWHIMPDTKSLKQKETLTAWRGERVSTQALIYGGVATDSLAPLTLQLSTFKNGRHSLPADAVKATFVRYVMTDAWATPDGRGAGCGNRPDHTIYDSTMVADMIDPHAEALPLEAMSTRSVWVSCQVPTDAAVGTYNGYLSIKAGKRTIAKLPLSIKVINHTLPDPKEWVFHLDLWQNPFTEARYYGTPLWSDAHLEAMRPSMEMLAAAGQKVITTSIMHKPWNGQTEDHFDSMVTWVKKIDGTWDFSFAVFDRWVEFMMSCGIDSQINCYTMIPWALTFAYYDEATNRMQSVRTAPGEAAYEEMWVAMLKAFSQHLREKGWFDITAIAMDERPMRAMQQAMEVIRKADPEFKVALAGNYHPEIEAGLYDYCIALEQGELLPKEVLERRKAEGKKTTVYTCCSTHKPNTFTFSTPCEASWYGFYVAHSGYDGYLRWAYNSWTKEPLHETRFRSWPAGDTYMVYPHGRSSVRFEKLIEGIQAHEKARILREEFTATGNADKLAELNEIINSFNLNSQFTEDYQSLIRQGQNGLNKF
ncbi:MAG: DUF4091 domain-containing protein [Bacteroidaceae bacterium]|nr:DUF4091 domain-containing protein [Bacteroidaceae bacterium]